MTTQKKPPVTKPVKVQALKDNIHISASTYFENTCRVAGPTQQDPQGHIFVFPGEPRPILFVISRPIYDGSGAADVALSSSQERQLEFPNYLYPHTDNQLVRRKDGTFVAVKACEYWKAPQNPTSWQQHSFQGHEYYRGANVCWHGSATDTSWGVLGAADPFVFENGEYGHPRDVNSPTGNVGSDRPQLYACPFTGYLFLTARYLSGPYVDASGTQHDAFEGILLLYSKPGPKQGQEHCP
jgi:hypothetical protein